MSKEKRTQMTVAVFYDSNNVLLAMKKRGFGSGWYNGFGGSVEPGETVTRAARRETFEEGKILVGGLERLGLVDFEFEGKPNKVLEVHFFKILNYFGEPEETEEMRPEWFGLDEIPYGSMFPADRVLFPLLLKDQRFKGKVKYNSEMSGLLENTVRVVDRL